MEGFVTLRNRGLRGGRAEGRPFAQPSYKMAVTARSD